MSAQESTVKTIALVIGTVFFVVSIMLAIMLEVLYHDVRGTMFLTYLGVAWFIYALLVSVAVLASEIFLSRNRPRQNLTIILSGLTSLGSLAVLLYYGIWPGYYLWEITAMFGAVLTLNVWGLTNLLKAESASQSQRVSSWYCSLGHEIPVTFRFCPNCGESMNIAPTQPQIQHPSYP